MCCQSVERAIDPLVESFEQERRGPVRQVDSTTADRLRHFDAGRGDETKTSHLAGQLGRRLDRRRELREHGE